MDRYSRQVLFPPIGAQGQKALGEAFAVIVGCGALGSISASSLVRAGVGRVRIIDRDFIEPHNLQRQVLFEEEDISRGLPKAVAAARHLRKANSSIEVEGIVADVNCSNVERLLRGAGVVLDGLDNLETRLIVNDAALHLGIPWVYGGAVASRGMTMNIVPGRTACLRCVMSGTSGGGTAITCDTGGVIGPAPWVVGSLQAAEAIKIIVGAPDINRRLLLLDVWKGSFRHVEVQRRQDCPACQGRYDFLDGRPGRRTATLCGQNAVQVLNPGPDFIPLSDLAARLGGVAEVACTEFMLRFAVDGREIVVFPDGRAIVNGTTDETTARALYDKYIGA